MKTENRDPKTLRPHPLLKLIPPPAADAPEVLSTTDGILDHGSLLHTLTVDEHGHLLDDTSRLHWLAAQRAGLAEVRVEVRDAALAPVILARKLCDRRDFTQSAKAYLLTPMLKQVFEAARDIRLRNLKTGENPNVSRKCTECTIGDYGAPQNADELAERLGICRRMLFSARSVHREFDRDKKLYPRVIEGGPRDGETVEISLKDYYEPRILRQPAGGEHETHRPMGLGAVLAGIAGDRETPARKPESDQLDLFSRNFNGLFFRLKRLGGVSDSLRAELRHYIESHIETDEDIELLDQLGAELRAAARAKLKKARD